MSLRNLLFVLIPLLFLTLLSSCGHSEYYDNGYKSGYSHGQSDVREVLRITDQSKHKYASSSDFNANTAYEMMKQTTVWGLDESHESEFRSGFVDGYKKGVKDQLDGKESKISTSHSDSSSQSNKEFNDTGIKRWQWIILIIVTAPIIQWLGVLENINDVKSESKVEIKLVQPWKSFLVIIFVVICYIVMASIFDFRVNNWSTYFMDILYVIALWSAYKNTTIWTQNYGKSFLTIITKFLSAILLIIFGLDFCINLYHYILE